MRGHEVDENEVRPFPSLEGSHLRIQAQRLARIPTPDLNKVMHDALTRHKPPSKSGKQLKILYATQADVAPPTFAIFVNDAKLVHFSYQRYLENRIRSYFPFEGTPIKLIFRNRSES